MDKFTEKIKAYLDTPSAQRDIPAGALLLLQINKNRILYNNVIRRPEKFADRVANELKKHLIYRMEGITRQQVTELSEKLMPAIPKLLEEMPVISTDEELPEGKIAKGKRADHDQLPEDIQALWTESAELWFRIKNQYETVKAMADKPACERYEALHILDMLDQKYRKNMEIYDHATISGKVKTESDGSEQDAGAALKTLSSARSYLTTNKAKLTELMAAEQPDQVEIDKIKTKMQERIDTIYSLGADLSEANIAELTELGLTIPTKDEAEQPAQEGE